MTNHIEEKFRSGAFLGRLMAFRNLRPFHPLTQAMTQIAKVRVNHETKMRRLDPRLMILERVIEI